MSSNPYSSKSGPAVQDSAPVEAAKEAPVSEVPSGSAKEVLAWVGDDRKKAQEALEAEKEGAERKTLIASLQALLDD